MKTGPEPVRDEAVLRRCCRSPLNILRRIMPRNELLDQIASVGLVESRLVERVGHEALTVPNEWVTEYGRYQSGGWHTVSLLNGSGETADVTIRDCDPVATPLLERMPATRRFLDSLGLRFMWVRLARLAPNAFLWEHRDYGELDAVERRRLHVPLVTNPSAALVLGGVSVHLRTGHLWRLGPTYPHGACNLLGPDRIHLIADYYADPVLDRLHERAELVSQDVRVLPAASQACVDEWLEQARSLAALGYTGAAERLLLRLFYQWSLPEGAGYELIASLYERLGDEARARSWRAEGSLLLGRAGLPEVAR